MFDEKKLRAIGRNVDMQRRIWLTAESVHAGGRDSLRRHRIGQNLNVILLTEDYSIASRSKLQAIQARNILARIEWYYVRAVGI